LVVLRGAGEGSFIAGDDIESFARFDVLDAKEYGTCPRVSIPT
jgi:enoyl-CoA hydratase/carnithine racemase